MKTLKEFARRAFAYFTDRTGVSTVEYALILVAVIAIVGVAGLTLQDQFEDLFKDLGTQIEAAQKKLNT